MEKAASYVGKMDREVTMVRENDYISKRLLARNEVHRSISRISDNLPTTICSPEAVQLYLDVRRLRHDNWCEFITESCTIENVVIKDTKVIDFIKDIIKIEVDVPSEIASLTPDILVISDNKRVVYIGDVSVSVNPDASRRTKHNKYIGISNFLNSNGVKTEMIFFNLSDRCSNVYDICNYLQIKNFITVDTDRIKLYEAFSLACNALMITIRGSADDKELFNKMLASAEKVRYDNPVVQDIPYELRLGEDLIYTPIIKEDDLIKQIKDETDLRHTGSYFSKDIKDSLREIDTLIEDNKKAVHTLPKSTLKVVDNSQDMNIKTDYDLIEDYLDDVLGGEEGNVKDYLIHLLPSMAQLKCMRVASKNKMTHKECRSKEEFKEASVYGRYQYKIQSGSSSVLVSRYKAQIVKGKKSPNVKKVPETINLAMISDYHNHVNVAIEYYGSLSNKPPILSDDWEAKTKFEYDTTVIEKEMYDYTVRTNGAQLCNSMSLLYNRISHLSTSLSIKDNIFVPPNGSFIAIMPGNHAPVTSKNVDMPFVFITRCVKGSSIRHIEYEHFYEGDKYIYYISKLSRLNVDKISNWSNANFKLVSTSCYLLSKASVLIPARSKVIGTLTHFILDVHQKTSEYLDLFKYISFMPFADISRLPNLIKDKMNLLMKTRLDGWMLSQLREFISELGKKDKLNAQKPRLKKFQTDVVPSSLGITMTLPSFCNTDIRHSKPEDFIEEINVMNTVRPKHLYGSQFMDKSITQTCEWNDEYSEEVKKYGGWAIDGVGEGKFPFDAKFCYSADAIHYAELLITDEYSLNEQKTTSQLGRSLYSNFMHKNCSLRGCTKEIKDRDNATDIHTTSLEACLRRYRELKFKDDKCTALAFGISHILSKDKQQYSMSEKDQRGGGRPIATPTIGTKAALMLVEKPESVKGSFMANNIIVPGKNKLREQCETYKMALSEGSRQGYKMAFQLTEDQTKYSENDNPRKFIPYIKSNRTLSSDIKSLQCHVINGLIGRDHLIKRMPIGVTQSESLSKYIVRESHSLGVSAIIGWPQGMLNFISTNVHCAADLWITKAYNKSYPDRKVYTKGLVHSDDSWVVVCCNSVDDFERFTIFRMLAKKMFCLKLNEKKLWGSRYLGELVSNYNLNGNVHLSVGKMLANSFGNLSFQNWPVDVNNQVSSLQQCYRNGASLGVIIMLSTLLKQQMINTYNVKGHQLENISVLPIEMGGYPDCSAFELAVSGVACYYKRLLDICKEKPKSITSNCIQQCLEWSIKKYMMSENIMNGDDKHAKRRRFYEAVKSEGDIIFDDDDFVNLSIPSRGNIFSAIMHIMPKSRKLSKTLAYIKSLRDEFPSNGLELIVTKPLTLAESIGHLCAQTTSMVYELAADKYNSCNRRMAISQTLQSTGKVVKINDMAPMTFNQLIEFVMMEPITDEPNISLIASAFSDDNDIVGITNDIVYHSGYEMADKDKRKVITKMPFIEDKFNTIGKIQEVLLTVIDLEKRTNLLVEYFVPSVSIETLKKDAQTMLENFKSYFKYYDTVHACNLIAQQYHQTLKARLWTQPHLRSDCLTNFLSDLYGKTVNNDVNYRIHLHVGRSYEKTVDQDMTRTLYFTAVLNTIYPDCFKIEAVDNKSIVEAITKINHTKLSEADRLKYAVVQYNYLGNDDYIRKIHRNDHFRTKWVQPQKRVGTMYVGAFVALCSLGKLTLKITGKEGDLEIESNSTDVLLIMKAMHHFINTHFSHIRYENYMAWGERPFWRSSTRFSRHYLTYYNRVSSCITEQRGLSSIPVIINNDLTYGDDVSGGAVDSFELDSTLRVIYANDIRGKHRFMSVKQNFSLPCKDRVTIEPNFLQGIDCVELYRSGAIESLVMDSAHRINHETIQKLLGTGYVIMNSKIIGELLVNLLGKLQKDTYLLEIKEGQRQEEVVDVDLTGMTVEEAVAIDDTASPEDITSVNVEYIEGAQERAGALMRVHDIPKVLCMAYTGHIPQMRVESLIHHLLTNATMMDWGKQMKKDFEDGYITKEDYCEGIIEDISKNVTLPTYAFLLSSGLNLTDTWRGIDARSLAQRKVGVESTEYMLNIVTEIVSLTGAMHDIPNRQHKTLMDYFE